MTDVTLHQPSSPFVAPLAPLRAAVGRDSDLVHLVPVAEAVPAQHSLCGTPVIRQPPASLLATSGCAECAQLALERGMCFAEDRHGALVNLQRVPRCTD
jgi:hypothetical protein